MVADLSRALMELNFSLERGVAQMALTRNERFERGGFEQRDRLIEARQQAALDSVRIPAATDDTGDTDDTDDTDDDDSQPALPAVASEDQSVTRKHLTDLGYTADEIEKLIAGPGSG